jgi:hypothetical protein
MIVIIPCWRRPAHLAALLRTIERARLADQQRYVFMVDREPAAEIGDVIQSFELQRQIAGVYYQGNHGCNGPARNILHGWAIGLALSDDRKAPIGLLEEDLLVAEDIFEFWHDAMEMGPAGVSACRNQNVKAGEMPLAFPADQHFDSFVYRHVSYQSLAVAMRPEVVEEVLLHASPEYFQDPQRYVLQNLPDAGLPASACSQDALFHRLLRKWNLGMLYPVTPRACHVGWYGYNRTGGAPQNPVCWKRDAMKILAMTSDEMNEIADPRFRDIERCDLTRARVPLRLAT